MDTVAILFAVFAATTLGSALRVITARNPVHAVLYLVLAFFSSACLWLLLQAEFLAISLVLVYVGAVMVLFLFVVMMLDIRIDRLRDGFWRNLPLAAVVGVAIALQLWLVLSNGHWQLLSPHADNQTAALNNTQALGLLTFTEYVFPLQIAGAILLVAIVAAIALTHRRRADALRQSPHEQVRTRAADRVRVVDVPAAKPLPPETPEA
jgi:NADH-quinone oxidoreductase subunit J